MHTHAVLSLRGLLACAGLLAFGALFAYPVFLRILPLEGGLTIVSALQHVFGLAIAVLLYAVLLRLGVRAWLAALGAADAELNQIREPLARLAANTYKEPGLLGIPDFLGDENLSCSSTDWQQVVGALASTREVLCVMVGTVAGVTPDSERMCRLPAAMMNALRRSITRSVSAHQYFSSMRRMWPSVLPTFSTWWTMASFQTNVPAVR